MPTRESGADTAYPAWPVVTADRMAMGWPGDERRWASSPASKVLLRLLATAFTLFTVIVLVVGAANVSTALNPDPALRLVFGA